MFEDAAQLATQLQVEHPVGGLRGDTEGLRSWSWLPWGARAGCWEPFSSDFWTQGSEVGR